MANPIGNLAGWSDPQDPEFEAKLHELLNRPRRSTRQGRRHRHLDAEQPYFDLLWAATRKRGLPLASYLRRAVAAFIAHDLGIPFADVVAHTPYPREMFATGKESFAGKHDDGKGWGDWEIDTLKPNG